jgi:hypothetical protein
MKREGLIAFSLIFPELPLNSDPCVLKLLESPQKCALRRRRALA